MMGVFFISGTFSIYYDEHNIYNKVDKKLTYSLKTLD